MSWRRPVMPGRKVVTNGSVAYDVWLTMSLARSLKRAKPVLVTVGNLRMGGPTHFRRLAFVWVQRSHGREGRLGGRGYLL